MAKKRVIYALLYCEGYFMLSRNFRLQRAGDVNWLLKNYNFRKVAASIDELIIIDVSRSDPDRKKFLAVVAKVIDCCFVPVALGGRIDSFESAAEFIANGADKVVVNTAFDTSPDVVRRIADTFGSQCVIGAMDVRKGSDGSYEVWSDQGTKSTGLNAFARYQLMLQAGAGELLLQSIDKDGTGFGFDFDSLGIFQSPPSVPVILFGGCGKGEHMLEALRRSDVDAVATANLFNFIGDGLQRARQELLAAGDLDLARWNAADIELFRAGVRQ